MLRTYDKPLYGKLFFIGYRHAPVTILVEYVAAHENHDRDRRLVSANQRRRPHPGADRRVARQIRPRGDDHRAARLPYPPLPELPRNPRGREADGNSGAQVRIVPATGGAYCDRGPPRIHRATLLPRARMALHDLLPHAVSAVPQVPLAHSAVALVCGSAPLSRRRATLHGEHAVG